MSPAPLQQQLLPQQQQQPQLPIGLRTPEPASRLGLCTPEPPQQVGARTPKAKEVRTPKQRAVLMSTPVARKPALDFFEEPIAPLPAGPRTLRQGLRGDIDEAVALCSLPLLSLALARGQRCTGRGSCCHADHRVHEAVRCKHVGALEFLLANSTGDLESCCGGRCALQVALQSCKDWGDKGYVLAELLLRHGADPNCAGSDPKATPPLHDVAQRGIPAAAALLLSHGADPDLRDGFGHSPLHSLTWAAAVQCKPGHGEVLDLLLKAGAGPAQPDDAGSPPIRALLTWPAAIAAGGRRGALAAGTAVVHAERQALCAKLVAAETLWSRRAVALVTKDGLGEGGLATGSRDLRSFFWEQPGLLAHMTSFL
mmetsp:Transcript_88074/g.221678  ORF Transcript_88074/g.221678 Transcript_88074/m.221678 type:complete len:369 (+) Transcript_88074:62-1168(+)